MENFIEKHSTRKNIILGVVFILFINMVAFPFFPNIFFGKSLPINLIFDLQFGFDVDFTKDLLEQLGVNGRHIYLLSTLLIDTPYALVYGFIYAFIIYNLLKKNNLEQRFYYLSYIPFGSSIFDLSENFFIIKMINDFPAVKYNIVFIASISNQLKWSFAVVTVVIVIILLLKLSKIIVK